MYTVNVMEFEMGNHNRTFSFQGEDQGKVVKAAEHKFTMLVKLACDDVTEEDLECYLEDGQYKDDDGVIDVVITHPEIVEVV